VYSLIPYREAKVFLFFKTLIDNRIIFFFSFFGLKYDDIFDLRFRFRLKGWELVIISDNLNFFNLSRTFDFIHSNNTAMLYSSSFSQVTPELLDEIFFSFLINSLFS